MNFRTGLVGVACGVLSFGLTAAGLSSAQAAGHAPAATASATSYTPPPIVWGDCTDEFLVEIGAQCGTLVVPLDYAHPHGTTISMAVSRLRHTVADADYQGVMLTNPGGPGGAGTWLAYLQLLLPENVGGAYDWTGFDPRGVGASEPALTCDPSWQEPDRPPYVPSTRAIMNAWVTKSKAYAASCVTAPASGLLNHIKTTDTVADMESLRKALGQQRINFYGFSYGTYIGAAYATLHHDRVRRLVFDGVVDPTRSWYQSNQDQDRAFDGNFRRYFAWLAQHHDVFHVGRTEKQALNKFLAAQKALDRHAAQGILGGDELLDDFESAAYYVYDWNDIANAWSAYVNDHDPQPLIDSYLQDYPTSPGADNGDAIYLGTMCTDQQWPRSQAKLNADNWAIYRHYPLFTWANAWFNGPCAYWPAKAGTPVHFDGSAVKGHVLLINETYDAATPYSGALAMRTVFPTSSLIEGVGGTTHAGSLSGVACTDDTVANYLLTGAVPTRKPGVRSDRRCPPVPAPDASVESAKAQSRLAPGAGTDLREQLRQALVRAQLTH